MLQNLGNPAVFYLEESSAAADFCLQKHHTLRTTFCPFLGTEQ